MFATVDRLLRTVPPLVAFLPHSSGPVRSRRRQRDSPSDANLRAAPHRLAPVDARSRRVEDALGDVTAYSDPPRYRLVERPGWPRRGMDRCGESPITLEDL